MLTILQCGHCSKEWTPGPDDKDERDDVIEGEEEIKEKEVTGLLYL